MVCSHIRLSDPVSQTQAPHIPTRLHDIRSWRSVQAEEFTASARSASNHLINQTSSGNWTSEHVRAAKRGGKGGMLGTQVHSCATNLMECEPANPTSIARLRLQNAA
jgi:hypothetical protein